jgi:DNA-binding NtrC family response regulator
LSPHRAEENSSLKLLVRNAKGEAERGAIAHALERTQWNRKAAARLLNVSYRALLYKIQEYHLAPPVSARVFGIDVMRQAK